MLRDFNGVAFRMIPRPQGVELWLTECVEMNSILGLGYLRMSSIRGPFLKNKTTLLPQRGVNTFHQYTSHYGSISPL